MSAEPTAVALAANPDSTTRSVVAGPALRGLGGAQLGGFLRRLDASPARCLPGESRRRQLEVGPERHVDQPLGLVDAEGATEQADRDPGEDLLDEEEDAEAGPVRFVELGVV